MDGKARLPTEANENAARSLSAPSLMHLMQISCPIDAALEAYEKKTESRLLTCPLATELQFCDSLTAILSVIQ